MTAGILAVHTEDDEDSEGANSGASHDLHRVGNPKTSNPIVKRRRDDMNDLLNISLLEGESAANSPRLVAERGPGTCAARAVAYDYAQTVEDVGRLVWDRDLRRIRLRVALCALYSLDDHNSCTLGWLERLTHQMVQDCVHARAEEFNVSPAIAEFHLTTGIAYVVRRPVHEMITDCRMPHAYSPQGRAADTDLMTTVCCFLIARPYFRLWLCFFMDARHLLQLSGEPRLST